MPMDSPTGASSDVAAGHGPAVGQPESVGDPRRGRDALPRPGRHTVAGRCAPGPRSPDRHEQVLAHGRAAQPGQVEAGVDAGDHPRHVGVQLLGRRGVEEEHRVGHVPGRGPPLLDDPVDLRRALGEGPHHLVAHIAGAGLQLGRDRRLGAVPTGDPLAVPEPFGPMDERHRQDARRPGAVLPVPRRCVPGGPVVVVEGLDHQVAGEAVAELRDGRLHLAPPLIAVQPQRNLGYMGLLAPGGGEPHVAQVSLWLDSYERRGEVEAAIAELGHRFAGYLVVETLYDDYGTTRYAPPRDWEDGTQSPVSAEL